jgi:hypothetical protein
VPLGTGRPSAGLPPPLVGRADSDDECEGICENLCHPPPLLPFSRPIVELPELLGLPTGSELELPRSGRACELLVMLLERDPVPLFCPDSLK